MRGIHLRNPDRPHPRPGRRHRSRPVLAAAQRTQRGQRPAGAPIQRPTRRVPRPDRPPRSPWSPADRRPPLLPQQLLRLRRQQLLRVDCGVGVFVDSGEVKGDLSPRRQARQGKSKSEKSCRTGFSFLSPFLARSASWRETAFDLRAFHSPSTIRRTPARSAVTVIGSGVSPGRIQWTSGGVPSPARWERARL